ncbi:hypothetical protein [Sinomonas sp. P47F7]|uniref:hypothetical protein n=1 Tax=Sinomonas sp. P47F7 TaxID=3410987 RepID=UPI003BF5C4AD
MTANRSLGIPVTGTGPYTGTTTVDMRLALAGLYAENAPGVPRSGVLAQAASQLVTARADGMSFDIAPCQLVISRAANEGVYNPTLTGTSSVPTAAAPVSGSRWDLVYVLQRDPGKGDADNAPALGVVNGASGATPTKPYASVPAGAYVLAEAQVFSGTTYASQSPNTLAQVWRHTAARGGVVDIRSAAERAEMTSPALGQRIARLDLAGVPLEVWDGTAWNLDRDFAAFKTTDTNWSWQGGIVRSKVLGQTQFSAAAIMTRVAGGSFAFGTGDTLMGNFCPTAFLPPGNVYLAVSITNGGALVGQAQLVITTTGDFVLRTFSGSMTFPAGGVMYINGLWMG